MFSICKQFVYFSDDLFVIKRTIKESEKLDVDFLKVYFDADLVLKKDSVYYFTQKVETLEYEPVSTT
jgi:hypothetical protein